MLERAGQVADREQLGAPVLEPEAGPAVVEPAERVVEAEQDHDRDRQRQPDDQYPGDPVQDPLARLLLLPVQRPSRGRRCGLLHGWRAHAAAASRTYSVP